MDEALTAAAASPHADVRVAVAGGLRNLRGPLAEEQTAGSSVVRPLCRRRASLRTPAFGSAKSRAAHDEHQPVAAVSP